MGRELYDQEPVFRAAVDRCAENLRPHLGLDLRTLIHPAPEPATAVDGRPDLRRLLGRGATASGTPRTELDRTLYTQPAVFVLEYALGLLWQSWGVRPDALIGYSIGEYAAACLSGVLSLDDALLLVASRARLIEELPGGAMLAVPLSERRVRSLLGESLPLAAVNGAELCVVAGETERIDALAERLAGEDVAVRTLRTSHAFHSHMMQPAVERFTELVAGIRLAPPRIPYVSNVTGDWITPDQATDPVFWGRHLRHPVRFADGVARLWGDTGRLLLEIGPGQSLSSLALQARPAGQDEARRPAAFASLPGEYDRQSEEGFLLSTAGKLWSAGVDLDWAGSARRRRSDGVAADLSVRTPQALGRSRPGTVDRGHRPVRLTADDSAAGRPRPGGVHLITGGFGGVGLPLARHLARTLDPRLVLVGRSPLPPRETWDDWLAERPADDPAAQRVLAVRELEALGAEVLPVAADVTDEARMRVVADEVVRRFGAVHSLVHAAGPPWVSPSSRTWTRRCACSPPRWRADSSSTPSPGTWAPSSTPDRWGSGPARTACAGCTWESGRHSPNSNCPRSSPTASSTSGCTPRCWTWPPVSMV